MEDDDNLIFFYSFEKDVPKPSIPKDHLFHAAYAYWDFYIDIEKATSFSEYFLL